MDIHVFLNILIYAHTQVYTYKQTCKLRDTSGKLSVTALFPFNTFLTK